MENASWCDFYKGMAKSLSSYSENRHELFLEIKKFAAGKPLLEYLHFDRGDFWAQRNNEIDPFTVMAIFNRGISAEHRILLAGDLGSLFGVSANPPKVFHGIAHLDPRNSIYGGNNAIWDLFAPVLAGETGAGFCEKYNHALASKGNGQAMLTIALFWCNPDAYMALDGLSLPFISEVLEIAAPASKMTGLQYAEFLKRLKEKMPAKNIANFAQLAFLSWKKAYGD